MRGSVFFLAAVASLAAAVGCGKGNSPEGVCEHLVALREASTPHASTTSRPAKLAKCLDNIAAARAKMGETEWASFAPCATKAADIDAFVACSATMTQAAESSRRRAAETAASRDEAIKAKVQRMRRERAPDPTEAKRPTK